MRIAAIRLAGAAALLLLCGTAAQARDLDGKWGAADPATHAWFEHLASGKGLCCSFADGKSIGDVDWTTTDPQACARPETADPDEPMSGYCVRLNGQWLRVPEAAVITEPNRMGQAVVWPIEIAGKVINIRCFMPGAGT